MATSEYELASPPRTPRARELWLQQTAGMILLEDIRGYAMARVDPGLTPEARAAVQKGIDDALYGVMMIIDGVTGAISNSAESVELSVSARLVTQVAPGRGDLTLELDLAEGDGMCMGYHAWLASDFGSDPVATRRPK